jgi:type II secretory pathway component PulK
VRASLRRSRGGFVLVAALWLIVAMSAVGLDAALRSQAQRLAAANQLDAVRAREAALAGSEYARSRLTAGLLERREQILEEARRQNSRLNAAQLRSVYTQRLGQDDPWHEPARYLPQSLLLGEAEFLLDARDTGLALNVNSATEQMLLAFFAQGLRLDYAWAERLAAAIMDWRDEDDLPRVTGAERDEYIRAGAAALPANRPFGSVDEVRHVMGMTPELFQVVRPYLTTAGSGRVNVNAAPEPVLSAVPTFTPAVVAMLLRLRDMGQPVRNALELRSALGTAYVPPTGTELQEFNRRVTYATNEVEIISHGRVTGSPVTVTVRSIVGRSDAAALLLWRRIEQ